MHDEKAIRVIPHRGMRQIGGICTEVATDEARVLFDFGSPLEDEGDQNPLSIEGVTKGDIDCDAVFLTHYHGDHVGEVPSIKAGIPVYMQKTARRILQAQQEHMQCHGQEVWADGVQELDYGVPIIIKDLKITPIESDHSAIDSAMFIVEGHGKRILITGDYRMHGFRTERMEKTFREMGHIDLMITEGTNLSKDYKGIYKNEKDIEEKFKEIKQKYKYVFLFTSSSNIDRIAAFSRQVPNGQYVITDDYQKKILEIADEDREKEYKSHKVLYYSDYLKDKMENRGFGMVVRSGDKFSQIVHKYFDQYPEDTILIYSMWSGYRLLPGVKKILDIATRIETIHVSGHITKEDLEHVIDVVRPEKLMIHHTSMNDVEDEGFLIPANTEILPIKDGEVFELETMFSFKDKDDINHKTAEEDNLKQIAEICKEAFESDNPNDILKKRLRNKWEEEKEHIDTHEFCGKCETDTITEKRICRCMNYYDENSKLCSEESCKLKLKWKNVGEITVSDYEKPTKNVMEKVGGMDLILDDHYAVEVKPYYSKETLSRMFSEILTYTVDCDGKYEPGIAMFKYNHDTGRKSHQWETFKSLEEKEYLKEIMKHVKVFTIDYEVNGDIAEYKIELYN
ncbi:MBL fold metallo-hydrolase [Butyrivibrio sp. FCS014]|uniref:MBL fold metallo-hydrolase n=1 Tax=Butyrivibrio sp. FCS014 TaxID=1408304 RepID=UPI000464B44B|nr:MBL fold metallo-hydrolase [Butyrivibrio sp. FCS014]